MSGQLGYDSYAHTRLAVQYYRTARLYAVNAAKLAAKRQCKAAQERFEKAHEHIGAAIANDMAREYVRESKAITAESRRLERAYARAVEVLEKRCGRL